MNLFPFQELGAAHLAGGKVRLLADEMGLGKTPQAIRASEADPSRLVTIVAPAILAAEWQAEFAAWHDVPRSVAVIGQRKGFDPETADVVICSYDRATRPEVAGILAARRRRGAHLILDEAHYLKEPGTKRTIGILGECADATGGIAETAGPISFLTGTPAPNVAAELFPFLASAGVWRGSYWEFVGRYCYTKESRYGTKIYGLRNVVELRQMLAQIMLRRTSAVELPSTDYGELEIEPEACAELDELRKLEPRAAAQIDRAAKEGDFSKLDTPHVSQLRRLIGIAKARPVARRVGELLSRDPAAKIVLFCLHRTVIETISQTLQDFRQVRLVGGDTDAKRKKFKDQFQQDPETRIAICQMKAAGTGLTLTAGNHLWIVEPSWTPADNEQACKRIVRIGQKRETSVQFVTLKTSIDEAVNNVLRQKQNLIDKIMN